MIELVLYTLYILAWSLGRYFDLSFLGYTEHSPVWTCATFSFVHANVWHLLLNIYTFHAFYRRLTHLHPCFMAVAVFSVPFLAAVISRMWVPFSLPTVGASACVFMLVGMFTAEYTIQTRVRYYSILALSFVVQLFFWNKVNVCVHFVSFILGFIAAKLYYLHHIAHA